MNEINASRQSDFVAGVSGHSLGGDSLQLLFAELQLSLCAQAKSQASDYIEQIKGVQEEQKRVSEMIQQARQQQTNAKNGEGDAVGEADKSVVPDGMLAYMQGKGLAMASGEGFSEEEIAKVKAYIAEAKALQKQAAAGKGIDNMSSAHKNCTYMPKEMADFMDSKGLAYDKKGKDLIHNRKEWQVAVDSLEKALQQGTKPAYGKGDWDTAIASLQARQDALGTDTQQKMVYVQDFMGQYNSYLQGANSAIQQGSQTLGQLARTQ